MSIDLTSISNTTTTLNSPPFVNVQGVMNFRTLGGYPISHGRATTTTATVKPFHVFRSGELARITDEGKSKLLALGITTVFDMRSDVEIAKLESATPQIPGVEFVRTPCITDAAWTRTDMAEILKKYEQDEIGQFMEHYAMMLKDGGQAFRAIFTHLRDHPTSPCLVHCTAGKDRTGLFSALLLMLLGVSDEDVAKDYALSKEGLEPGAPLLLKRFQFVPAIRDNWDAFMKMMSARADTMKAALSMIKTRFGGADGYLKGYAGMSDVDLDVIRNNLIFQSGTVTKE